MATKIAQSTRDGRRESTRASHKQHAPTLFERPVVFRHVANPTSRTFSFRKQRCRNRRHTVSLCGAVSGAPASGRSRNQAF
jgi:hypothetical protein